MLFVPGEGKPLGPDDIAAFNKSGFSAGVFGAFEFDTFRQALQEADKLGREDKAKYGVFAWNKFVFIAEPQTVAKVKALLP